MKKAASKAITKVREVEPFDKRSVDLTKFKPDLSAMDINKLLGPSGSTVILPFGPIETLSPTKTIGRGRTKLTIIAPPIVQIDTPPPFARFDPQAPCRKPPIHMHSQPSGYGTTSVRT